VPRHELCCLKKRKSCVIEITCVCARRPYACLAFTIHRGT
jgi:hypothetical protein